MMESPFADLETPAEPKKEAEPAKEEPKEADDGQTTPKATEASGDLELSAAAAAAKSELGLPHPLQHPWVFWHFRAQNKDWSLGLKKVSPTPLTTVEEFWTLLLSVRWPSEMGGGASQDLYIFKEGIEPTWEDPGNAKGGRWIYYAPPYLQDRQVLDELWKNMLMAMVGEQFGPDLSDEICGAVCMLRKGGKGDKVALWTRSAILEEEQNKKIGMVMKTALGINESLKFETHEDCKNRASVIKPLYAV